MVSVVGLLVAILELILGVHAVCDRDRLVADEGSMPSRQDLGVERLRRVGPAQGVLDAHGAGVVADERRLRDVSPTIDLLVTELQLVREVRLHRHVLSTHGALEALPVEDDLVDGSDLLHLVDALPAPLTLVRARGEEQVREALRRLHDGGHLVAARYVSSGTQLNKSIRPHCRSRRGWFVADCCWRPLQCSTSVSGGFMYYSIGINNGIRYK